MIKFLNLLNDELKRSRGFYLILVGSVIIGQLLNACLIIFSTLQTKNNETSFTRQLFLTSFFDDSPVFGLIIGGAIMALLMYSLLTWLREWYFQGNFIYRLLMLPGNRIWIPLAKLASILLMIGGLLFVQLVLIWVIDGLALSLLPATVYADIPWYYQLAQSMPIIYLLMPMTASTAFLQYGAGLAFLLVIFNSQIYFYSYQSTGRVKAILKVSAYLMLCLAYLVGLVWVTFFQQFLPGEMYWLLSIGIVICIVLNSFILSYLMSSKISV